MKFEELEKQVMRNIEPGSHSDDEPDFGQAIKYLLEYLREKEAVREI